MEKRKEEHIAEQETSYDAIARVEIAIEILNQARAILTARVYELEDTIKVRPKRCETQPSDRTVISSGEAGWIFDIDGKGLSG